MKEFEIVIDQETGEVIEPTATFEVTNTETLEWVLEKISNHTATIAGLQSQLAGIQERLSALIRQEERKVEWLKSRFADGIETVARVNLAKGSKTYTSAWGKVSFRTVPERVAVVDEAKAIEWARQNAPGALKVSEKFLISKVEQLPEDLESAGLEVVPASERMEVKA